MHFYTSITCNYLPKARVLARSVKQHHPEAVFHVLLSDTPPASFDVASEPFDRVWGVEELGIEPLQPWLFQHSLVEMCTAVKGPGALAIVKAHAPKKLVYLDPDIVVFSRLQAIEDALDTHSVVLTPHLTDPEHSRAGILDNEISALKHGIYNLGFVGFRGEGEGLRCLQWWSDRLLAFCRDDIPGGLFTDQRWADHMPGLFEGVHILRQAQFNVATWNLSNRRAEGTVPHGVTVNGQPLGFYHFSGFDSGAQATMLDLYGQHSPVLSELRQWYIQRCEEEGQALWGPRACVYQHFSNGQAITRKHRVLYRERPDLQAAFPQPFDASDPSRSYCHWFEAHGASEWAMATAEPVLRVRLAEAERQLALMQRSRAWRWAQRLSGWARRLRA